MRISLRAGVVALAGLVLLGGAAPTRAVVIEGGDFVDLANERRDVSFESGNTNPGYTDPTMQQQTNFRLLAAAIRIGDTVTADNLAAPLGYEVVQYTDNVSADVYLGVREVLVNGEQTKGWGTYFVNTNATADAMIQAPHIRSETNIEDVIARVFRESGAQFFMLGGSHRSNGGVNNADPADHTDTIFHQVHEEWNGPSGQTVAYQFHGFAFDTETFALDTEVVLSNGDGSVSGEVVTLDAAIDGAGFVSYAYNTLNPLDPLNIAVNGVEDGAQFDDLAATTNVQGIFSRSTHGEVFVHIEIITAIRTDANDLAAIATAAAGAVAQSNAIPVPSPSSLAMGLAGLGVLMKRRGRGRGNASLVPVDQPPDSVPEL